MSRPGNGSTRPSSRRPSGSLLLFVWDGSDVGARRSIMLRVRKSVDDDDGVGHVASDTAGCWTFQSIPANAVGISRRNPRFDTGIDWPCAVLVVKTTQKCLGGAAGREAAAVDVEAANSHRCVVEARARESRAGPYGRVRVRSLFLHLLFAFCFLLIHELSAQSPTIESTSIPPSHHLSVLASRRRQRQPPPDDEALRRQARIVPPPVGQRVGQPPPRGHVAAW